MNLLICSLNCFRFDHWERCSDSSCSSLTHRGDGEISVFVVLGVLCYILALHDTSGSCYVFPAQSQESGISCKSPGFFFGGMILENKIGVLLGHPFFQVLSADRAKNISACTNTHVNIFLDMFLSVY